jgi:probable O-glycosylation ligase (exosortase A-associated)
MNGESNREFLSPGQFRQTISIATVAIASVILATLLLLAPAYIAFSIVAALVLLAVALKSPYAAFLIYVVVILLRPGEVFGIPYIAKLTGGASLAGWVFNLMQSKRIAPLTPLSKTMLAFFVAVSASVLTCYWLAAFTEAWKMVLQLLLLFFLIINLVDSPRKLRGFGVALLIIAGIVCTVSLISFLFSKGYEPDDRLASAFGTLYGDSNEFAQFILMFLPFPFILLSHIKRLYVRLLLIALIGVGLIGLIMSGSRGGFLGLVAVMIYLAVRGTRRFSMLMAVIVIAVMMAMLIPSSYTHRIESINDLQADESIELRLEAWQAGFRMFLSNPATGVGAGCFLGASTSFGMSHWLVAHNSFVNALAELGLFGFVPFVLLFYFAFKSCRRTRLILEQTGRTNTFQYVIASALPISLVGYIVPGLFLSTTYASSLYMLLGICAAIEYQIRPHAIRPVRT